MREYVDFLGGQSPYDELDAADLEALARLVEVEYFTAGTIIITAGEAPLSHFYVVRSGEVEVVDRGRVVDVLGTGETFGQISVLSGLPPPLTRPRRRRHAVLSVRRSATSACNIPNACNSATTAHWSPANGWPAPGLVDQALRLARHQMRPVVWCPPEATVTEAASAMTDAGQSCALHPAR